MKKVTSHIVILDTDTDSTIAEKLSERIGRKIVAMEWQGVSGSGVRGVAYLEVAMGGEPERVPFRAQAKRGVGGAFEIGDWIVPYKDATYQDMDLLTERIEQKLRTSGTLINRP